MSKYDETATYTLDLLDTCLQIHGRAHYAKEIIRNSFLKTVQDFRRLEECSENERDTFNDCRSILDQTLKACQACEQFFYARLQNSISTKWVRVTSELALLGKADAVLSLKEMQRSELYEVNKPRTEIWNVYLDPQRNKLVKKGVTSVSLIVHNGQRVELPKEERAQHFNDFFVFLFEGLEVLGYKTPVLDFR